MVNLDIDIELLTKYASLLGLQKSGSVNKNQEAQSTNGSKFYEQNGYSSKQLIEDFDLRDPKNRYAIIKLMKEEFQSIEVVRGGSVGIEAINMTQR